MHFLHYFVTFCHLNLHFCVLVSLVCDFFSLKFTFLCLFYTMFWLFVTLIYIFVSFLHYVVTFCHLNLYFFDFFLLCFDFLSSKFKLFLIKLFWKFYINVLFYVSGLVKNDPMRASSYLPLQKELNPLSANPTKWWNTLKQFVGKLPTSVFDHFVKLVLKGLKQKKDVSIFKIMMRNVFYGPS